ncbi:Uncharacterised protein [Paenibacillus polymyxa]|uniref:Uncharacterized protein n=1 Tax=Paenibacillus polymyxa TaxID=1406 RepID=A0A378Y0X8_PAEPO|nr:Uncharacterised protein [Paenibacillus polymyxa]
MKDLNEFWLSSKEIQKKIRRNKILYFLTRRKKYKDEIERLVGVSMSSYKFKTRCRFKY